MITSTNLYDYFENDLSEIKNIITLNLKNRDSSTSTLLNSLAATEGKMIRAIFTLIGGSFGEIDKSKLYNIAAGIEILHLATLVHDDIIDDSGLRRGKETINITHGAKTALFTGDYLFAQAFILFSESASRESFYNISKTIKFICQSEINQFLSKYSLNSTILDYFRRINGKCASLFSLSLSLGALDGHADDKIINTLKRIGYYVGTAFQLIDDILDITTPNAVLGKPSGNDLFEGIYTFPLLFEIKNKNVKLLSALESNDLSTVSDILKTSDGIKTAKKLAEKYTLKALSLIDTLPNSHEKTILKSIIDKLLKREY
jgi:heptaprenyl diphosphate synthase